MLIYTALMAMVDDFDGHDELMLDAHHLEQMQTMLTLSACITPLMLRCPLLAEHWCSAYE